MIIKLKSKKKGSGSPGKSLIQSGRMSSYCTIKLSYCKRPEVLEDIKKVLSKHYILDEQNYNVKKARGSVGISIRSGKRYREDEEFRNKHNKIKRKNYQKKKLPDRTDWDNPGIRRVGVDGWGKEIK